MTVSTINIVSSIFADFQTWWATSGATGICFPNKKYKPVRGQSFVRVSASPSSSTMLELGGNTCAASQTSGLFSCEIFVQAESGIESGYTLVDLILARYERKTLSFAFFDSGFIAFEGLDKENTGMYQINLVIPYHSIQ